MRLWKIQSAPPHVLGLAYQDHEGVWQFTGGNTVDTLRKTVSFESTHFSDWSLMPWLVLKPVNASLQEGEELTLEALHYIPFADCNCGDDIFIPLPGLYPVGLPQPLEQQYIGMWNLNGPGTLIPGVNNLAVFKAPASLPVNSSATVSIQLKSVHTLILVSNITLQSNSWFEIRINGGSWKSYDAAAAQLDAGKCAVSFVKNNEKFSMFFPAATGTYYWDEVFGQATASFAYWPNGTATAYESNYIKDLGVFDSDGGVSITAYGPVNGYVAGSFSIIPAGYYTVSNSRQMGTYTIEGRFRLKRMR